MKDEHVEQVRRFNRDISRRIGALEESYLARGRPLGEARLIWEIGAAGEIEIRALREKLGLDSGYVSRLLRKLEKQGLVENRQSRADARSRTVRLSREGKAEFAAYDAMSDDLAITMLGSLDDGGRVKLAAAMARVENLLRSAQVTLEDVPADCTEAETCLNAYFAELDARFADGFDPYAGSDEEEGAPAMEHFVIARFEGKAAGCGMVLELEPGIAEIKRVWIAPELRGTGVASRIMDQLEVRAREGGYRLVRLDTNGTLTEAQAMYRKRGYREIPCYNANPFAEHWFEKEL
ncbi:MAG: MarR family transcriptional regulator [Nitratireductor sp.]|nr:MarR family transcriptional regulator [Nitratireductor sp.]MCB1423560.1 MarR family transcriptional regulator [Nitratireductor sp.]